MGSQRTASVFSVSLVVGGQYNWSCVSVSSVVG